MGGAKSGPGRNSTARGAWSRDLHVLGGAPRSTSGVCVRVWTGELMASLESSRLDGQTGDVETEVPQSARWLYCGEPDDRQKAVLGKDCGTRADFRVALPSPPPHYLEVGQSPRYPPVPRS